MKKHAKRLGEKGLRHALFLYYTLQVPSVPKWAKTVIIGALGYLIFTLDALSDFIPVPGLTDDLRVLAAAIATLELVSLKARQRRPTPN
ncbi:MAG: YkvA family protein [Desulfomonilaceae bacterium]